MDKNCISWAQEHIQSVFKGLELTKDDLTVSVTSVKTTGDVDLTQRKGKIRTIYDLRIECDWKGDAGSHTADGKIIISEFEHDVEASDIPFEVTCIPSMSPLKDLVRKELANMMAEKLSNFREALIEAHVKDVYIAPAEASAPAVAAKPKIEFAAPVAAEVKTPVPSKSKLLGSVCTVFQTVEFVCHPSEVYKALIEEDRVRAWTRSKTEIKDQVGSKFSLFDGNVTGEILKVEKDKMIEMTWRLRNWPEGARFINEFSVYCKILKKHLCIGHYSHVIITLSGDDASGSTTLKLVQKDVPIGEKELTEKNWKGYYWGGIKGTFGYVILTPDSIVTFILTDGIIF